MKLKDLISKLQALNPEAEVMLECPDTNWGTEILGANGVQDSTLGHPGGAGREADAADLRVILVSERYL